MGSHLINGLRAAILMTLAPAVMAVDLFVPTDFDTIQLAIDAAAAGDTVIVEPGTYEESINLRTSINVRGREVARTFIEAPGANSVVIINNANDLIFSNFTIVDVVPGATVGIDVANSMNVQVANNVLYGEGVIGTGVRIDPISTVDVLNNVFWSNTNALTSQNPAVQIMNNAFVGSMFTITGEPIPNINIDSNCFFQNEDLEDGGANTGIGVNAVVGDPLFVDTGVRDFHLRENSPCIDAGIGLDVIDNTAADIGAYGGSLADARPFPVAAPILSNSSAVPPPPTNILVEWDPNLAYLVTNAANPGTYRVYYQQNQSGPPYNGTDAGNGTEPSPVDAGTATTLTLSDLNPVVPAAPPAPVLNSADTSSQSVTLVWSAVATASAYRVHYGESSVNENQIDVGNTTTTTVTGLENGVTYLFAVSGLGQATYHISIVALDNTQNQNQSFFSDESTIAVGPFEEGALSNQLTATPSITVAYPNLPDKGCFVATAAFGARWSAEVEVLRDFRDVMVGSSGVS